MRRDGRRADNGADTDTGAPAVADLPGPTRGRAGGTGSGRLGGMVRTAASANPAALAAAFTDLGPAWGRWITVCTPSASVSYIRMRLLRVLDQGGEHTMTQLADALNITQRRVTALVDALLKDHMIERRPNPHDGRSSVITLTDSGREHLERTWQQFQNDIAAAFTDLSTEQQEQLLAITPVLTAALRDHTSARTGTA
jgi:DNA-binding MarR family transcriptional regulator